MSLNLQFDRYAGIDVASQTHVVAITSATGDVLVKPTPFAEDAAGYQKLFAVLGDPKDVLVVMEATGHYGRNLFAALNERSFSVAVVNPLRTRRFAEEDLRRAKTDSIDALGIARFGAQKRPAPTPPTDDATEQMRQLVWLFDRFTQDYVDRRNQLHRQVDLGFPEFTRHVLTLDSQRATTILAAFPTAAAFGESCYRKLAALRVQGKHKRTVGPQLARALINSAKISVGRHHGPAHCTAVHYICEDIAQLRTRLDELQAEIVRRVREHPIGVLLTTIDGLGPVGVARIIAAVGDPAKFRSGAALAAYVGAVPGTRMSGLASQRSASLSPIGNARLRRSLYMTTLGAVRRNVWLRSYYERLRAKGKPPKVALIAAMRKLLMAIYSVAKHRQPFVPRVPSNNETLPDPE